MASEIDSLFGFNVRKTSGIYCAIHRDSGRCYVGSSVNIYARIREHFQKMTRGGYGVFYKALREFGIEAFDFSVLQECGRSELLERERFYISLFDAASMNGFNTRANPCATYDCSPSPATRARISASKKGHRPTLAQRLKQSEAQRGRKPTPETRLKISAAHKGRKFTKDHRDAIKWSRKGMGLSAEHRAAIGAGITGRKVKPESTAKQRATLRRKMKEIGPLYHDHRRPIVVTDENGKVTHVFESLLECVAGLKAYNSSLRYYLNNGKRTPRGMFLFYSTIDRGD